MGRTLVGRQGLPAFLRERPLIASDAPLQVEVEAKRLVETLHQWRGQRTDLATEASEGDRPNLFRLGLRVAFEPAGRGGSRTWNG